VINKGFHNLNLRHAMAAGCNHLRIKETFPLGTMLNVVKLEVTVTCEENMLFTGTTEFYDNQDQVCSIEVSATQDASQPLVYLLMAQPAQGILRHSN